MDVTSKRRKWVVITTIVAGIALVLWLSRDSEPTYGGKSLSQWCDFHAKALSLTAAYNVENRAALAQFGTNALPFLLEWIRYEPSKDKLRLSLAALLKKIPREIRPIELNDWVSRPNDRARAAAAAFGALGDEARPAIPELVRLMNDPTMPNASTHAVFALGAIGPAATSALAAQLANTNSANRAEVIRMFIWNPDLATNNTSIVPSLVNCLNDSDPQLRFFATTALGQIADQYQPAPHLVLPAVTDYLQTNPGNGGRAWSAKVIGAYGELARDKVPLLIELAHDQSDFVRAIATNALMKIAPEVLTNAPPQ